MKRFYWKGIARQDRHVVIGALSEIIGRWGILTGFQRYSDVVLGMVIETEGPQLKPLQEDLREVIELEPVENPDSPSGTACLVMLSVTFTQASGNLEIEVPAVPG